ncbi:MAG TPA: FAD-binding oxidoreductase [Spirochaetales bacterium]|nr:FAD-binding oxidoreductase [Spirochaetales bacterium]HQG39403.1 FAD-binding oxidoreductase [Spirochaetales bacterium]HQK34750.1 FAD-binding oxidoreductase [Spirochaetales bacterium]
MKTCDILILGAGSVGVPLAYFCAQKGLSVIVIEKNASWGRGQNRAAIGGIRATHSDPAKIAICKESINIVRSMQEEQGIDIEWKAGGYLFVAYDAERETAFKNLLKVQHEAGLNIDWIGPERVNQLVPGINMEGLRGGTYSPEDGYASPLMTGTAFYKLAKEAGAVFHFCETVTALKTQGSQITTVITDKDEYAAKLIVNAAGADAAELASLADLEIPVHPDCHEAGVTDPVERFMVPMLVDIRPDDKSGNYYFYQAETGQIVFCITPKPQIWGKDTDNTSGFLPHVLRRMVALYPRLANLKIRRTWRGLYPMTPDGLPIVGYAHELDNFLLLVGMCGQGFMLGPGLGKIMAEVITDSRKPQETQYGYIFEELSLYRKFEGMEMLK